MRILILALMGLSGVSCSSLPKDSFVVTGEEYRASQEEKERLRRELAETKEREDSYFQMAFDAAFGITRDSEGNEITQEEEQ